MANQIKEKGKEEIGEGIEWGRGQKWWGRDGKEKRKIEWDMEKSVFLNRRCLIIWNYW